MNKHTQQSLVALPLLVGALTLGGSLPAAAATVDLKAERFTQTMSDGATIEMWGFGLLTDAQASAPGPILTVPAGDTTLTINLTNRLDEPVSIVLPGQIAAMTPVWDDGSSGARPSLSARVVSFAQGTAPGATRAYTFTNLKPGTFLYESGTHPAKQVQMGLYGALRVLASDGGAYAGLSFDNEAVVLLSEIDPALHAAVADGTYGTPVYPSTFDYQPKYFLINGLTYPSAMPEWISAIPHEATVGERVLLRLLNAGLESHVLVLQGGYFDLVAEDGNAYNFSRRQYSALMAAGNTRDAIFVPEAEGLFALYDRRLRLTDHLQGPGGMLTHLSVVNTAGAPVATMNSYATNEDTILDTAASGLQGVLENDTGVGLTAYLVDPPLFGTLSLAPDGSFVYAPPANFFGTDHFSYRAGDGSLVSNVAMVQIDVAAVNDAPVAAADSYVGTQGLALVVGSPGLLGNDSDVDGDLLSVALVDPPTGGTLTLGAFGAFEYLPGVGTTSDQFSYVATDGLLDSLPVTVTIALLAPVNVAPVALDDYGSTPKNTAVVLTVLANDSDADGWLVPGSVTIVTAPTRGGTAVPTPAGTVRYTPKLNFRGTDVFTYTVRDNQGAVSNVATVRVNVTK